MRANHVKELVYLDVFVGRRHVSGRHTVDVAGDALGAPATRVSSGDTEDGCRLEPLEFAHVPLDYANHFSTGVTHRGFVVAHLPHGHLWVTPEYFLDAFHYLVSGHAHRQPEVGLKDALTGSHVDLQSAMNAVSYTHLRAHETRHDLVC